MKKLILIILTIGICLPNLVNAQGCATPSSDEGVTVWGYLQPELDTYFEDETKVAFQFRRMRVGLMGNIPYDFSYYVLVEMSQFLNPNKTGPFLMDAFVAYNRFQNFRIALGSYKYPFGRELSMPCQGLYTINRSKVVDELTANLNGGNRDIGLMFLGGSDSTLFTYRAALTNGTGMFQTENNLLNTYAVTGRLTIQPIKGFYLGASAKYTQSPPTAEGVEDDDTKMRFGFDAQYSHKNLTILGEYIDGKDEGSYTEGGGCGGDAVTMTGTNSANGFYVMALYRFGSNLEPVYKIENFDTKKSDGSDVPVTTDDSSWCQTFGLNYYPNDWSRLQLNYIYRSEQPNEINNDMLLFQVQVKF